MPEYAVQVLADAMREKRRPIKGSSIALLGLARGKDNSDTTDSAALKIRDKLSKKGANVRSFDPFVSGVGGELKEVLRGADAVVIATDHSLFCNLTPRHFEEFGVPLVVDVRNCLDKRMFDKSSVTYRGIGRG
jgi:UDP-N-acetyl-D-mannosaminuronate dehydrogenase